MTNVLEKYSAEELDALLKISKTIDEYGIQPLFNYKKQILPVYADKNVIQFSPSNYLYDPLPYFPKDHFVNKNRRPWSFEEKQDLLKEMFPELGIVPTGFNIILEEINVDSPFRGENDEVYKEWKVGRVIAMGESAWDFLKFPMGARATYNDWVLYHEVDTKRHVIRDSKVFITIKDVHIQHVIDCPIKLSEA